MLRIIDKFKKIIRFMVTIFASREFAFIYCLLGTLTQVAHTYFLTESISSFTGGFKVFQAVLLSTFISSSLLYFVAVAEEKISEGGKRIYMAINIFMYIEILINIYYYSRHLIIDSKTIQIFDFIFAVLISALIPVTIKLYASSIRAKEWMEEMTLKKPDIIVEDFSQEKYREMIVNTIKEYIDSIDNTVTIDENEIHQIVESYLENNLNKETSSETRYTQLDRDDLVKDILKTIDSDIAEIFNKQQKLFLTQTENKIKLIAEKSKADFTSEISKHKISINQISELAPIGGNNKMPYDTEFEKNFGITFPKYENNNLSQKLIETEEVEPVFNQNAIDIAIESNSKKTNSLEDDFKIIDEVIKP